MIYGRAGAPAGPLDTGRNSKPPCRASGTPRIIRRTGLGEPPAVSPTRTPSRLTHMSSGESGQQGPQGLCTAPELGEGEQASSCPVIPRLLGTALLPRATTSGRGRPHPQPLLDPLARVGGRVGTVTPLHSTTTLTPGQGHPRHAGAATPGEKQPCVNCEGSHRRVRVGRGARSRFPS